MPPPDRCISPPCPKTAALLAAAAHLAAGLPERAKEEAERALALLKPYLDQDMPILGLEPSCHLGYRDEIPGLVRTDLAAKLAKSSKLVIEFLEEGLASGGLSLPLKSLGKPILVHGHCHEKSYGAAKKLVPLLLRIPDSPVSMIDSSCCGKAALWLPGGNRGSLQKIELFESAVRQADQDTILVRMGLCRHQIADLTARGARPQSVSWRRRSMAGSALPALSDG